MPSSSAAAVTFTPPIYAIPLCRKQPGGRFHWNTHMNPILKGQAYINADPPAKEAEPTV
jgi:hypothetical protein